jgi:3-oxo-5-alpha-steroid 4-dehydrogenase 3
VSWKDWTALHSFGIALFLYGSVEQHRAHVGFANLRKKGWLLVLVLVQYRQSIHLSFKLLVILYFSLVQDNKVVSYSHQIPQGGLFDLVSCPNYWTEILIYVALAMIPGFQNPSFNAVTVWVICNQVSYIILNHNSVTYFATGCTNSVDYDLLNSRHFR